MSTTQAFLLGVMAGWVPSLVILAWDLIRSPRSSDPDHFVQRAHAVYARAITDLPDGSQVSFERLKRGTNTIPAQNDALAVEHERDGAQPLGGRSRAVS